MRRLELRRQLIHLALGTLFTVFFSFGFINWFFFLLLVVFSYAGYFFLLKFFPGFLKKILVSFDRKKVFLPAWGAFSFFLGFFVSSVLFPKDVACASMIILTFGDSVSTLVGTVFGNHKLHYSTPKSWEGSLAGFFSAFLGAIFFVSFSSAFIGSFFGMCVESLHKKNTWVLDDNLLIPLVSGALMFFFSFL